MIAPAGLDADQRLLYCTLLTDSVQIFVVKLNHNWLLVGARERRCSATIDICRSATNPEAVPQLYLWLARAPWRHHIIT